jgi:hypothetical protein
MKKLFLLTILAFTVLFTGLKAQRGPVHTEKDMYWEGWIYILPGSNNYLRSPEIHIDTFLALRNDTIYMVVNDTTERVGNGSKYNVATEEYIQKYVARYGGGGGGGSPSTGKDTIIPDESATVISAIVFHPDSSTWYYTDIVPVTTDGEISFTRSDSSNYADSSGIADTSLYAISSNVVLYDDILQWDNVNKWYEPYVTKPTGLGFYTDLTDPDGTTRLTLNGQFRATNVLSANTSAVGIIGNSTTNTGVSGNSNSGSGVHGSSATGAGLFATSQTGILLYVQQTAPQTEDHTSHAVYILRGNDLINNNQSGDLIHITDNPTRQGIVTSKILTANVDGTERVSLYPRATSGQAYLWDTDSDVSGFNHTSFRNQGTEFLRIRTDSGLVSDYIHIKDTSFLEIVKITGKPTPGVFNVVMKNGVLDTASLAAGEGVDPQNNILQWDGVNNWYAPYVTKPAGLGFYTGSTNPDGTTRLNINGNFYATNLAGKSVTVDHEAEYGAGNGLLFGNSDTRIYKTAGGALQFDLSSSTRWVMTSTYFSNPSGYGAIRNVTPSATNPVFVPNINDINTGIGWNGNDQLSLIANGIESGRVTTKGLLSEGDSVLTEADLVSVENVLEPIKYNKLNVDISGGQFTSIGDALDSVWTTGADSLNRWVIEVGNGFFNENVPLNVPKYTTIKSISGFNGTVVVPNTNEGAVFVLSDLCFISGLTVIGGGKVFCLDTTDYAVRIENCILNSCDTAISVTGGYMYTSNVVLASDVSKIDIGIYCSGGTVQNENVLINRQDSISTFIKAEGLFTRVTASNLTTSSRNLDTVLYASNNANVVINTSYILFADNIVVAYDTANIRYSGNTHFFVGNAEIVKDETSVVAGMANTNANDEAISVRGQEFHVGDAINGYEVAIGRGDSYSDRLLVYEYNGSTYTEVSDSAKDIDGYAVEFPNTSINTAIYFASDYDTIIHHGIKIITTDSMTVGSGEVVLEYWNGTAWTEFNGMSKDSEISFEYHAKNYFEQSEPTHILYDINMTNDDWTANDPMSRGEVKKWVRARISTAITASPRIDQIKLHSSRTEINPDGTIEVFANARYSQTLQLNIGSGRPVEGNMQSGTIYVDENIGVGYQSNRFTSTGDILGFPINFPDNIDTSSPVNVVWSGRASSATSIQWTVRYFILTENGTLYTTEPTASGNAKSATTVARTAVVGANELFSVELDVSEAIPSKRIGYGDQLWITLEPTTITGNFDLTNIGAEYWAHILGGHK